MRKLFLVIAVAMMGILFAGCNKEVEPDLDVAHKIIGKWIYAETDGKVLPTNEKIVYEFVSATKAYVSLSFTDDASSGTGAPWTEQNEVSVDIVGNDVTLTHSPEPGKTVIVEIHVNAITGTTMIGKRKVTVRQDGGLVKSDECMLRCEKLDVDYSTKILGLWEGRMTSEQSAYDDGQEHRWEFKEDGTFVFYLKNYKGIWEAMDDEFAEYFVAGDLLCTRWKNAGEGAVELREWWEIATAGGSSMVWIALREKEDGSQYTAAFSMEKISVPTQAEVEAAIIGKWMNAEINGKPCLTDDKGVYTFLNTTSARMSASVNSHPELGDLWNDSIDLNMVIKDNVVTLSHQLDEHKTMTIEMTVVSINAGEMHADVHATLMVDGVVASTVDDHILYEKIKENYRKSIRGLWEGRRTAGGTTEYHRWEYLGDGHYNFYLKIGEGQWVMMEDEFSEYFVDGRLLCTRWKNAGEGTVENREWWEIRSIENDTMIWTALRQNELGEQYVESFTMNKVQVPTADEIMRTIKSTKWMTEKLNGEIALTNEKAVFTFFSRTQAAISASFVETLSGEKEWATQREFDYVIENNVITLTCKLDENTTFVDEMKVGFIDDENIHCMYRRTLYQDGRTLPYPAVSLELRKQEKTPVNYGSYILGTWEGRATSDHSQYDDGQVHRWKYEGKNYVYYVKQGNNWVPSSNTENEYYVDGRLLLTRWVDNGVEYREWWEIISLDDQTMIWGAIREDEYGKRYPASFALTRIEYWEE
ncbi:MAG: hypothetical protein J6P62_02000 [Bacteroidales bacterium]|nr:hypothetical protein [Bacteroidales bacterium]